MHWVIWFFPIWIVIGVLLCVWVYRDAKARGVDATLWLVIVLLTGIIGLIVWLAMRPEEGVPAAAAKPTAGTCPHCGAALGPGAKFCTSCGKKVGAAKKANVCPSCGAELKPGAKFCTSCGKRLE